MGLILWRQKKLRQRPQELVLLALIGAFLVSSCAKNHSDQSDKDRLNAQLDQGNYEAAISSLEAAAAANPNDKTLNLRLIEAHLGAAGFVMQNMAEQTFSAQSADHVNQLSQKRMDCGLDGITNKDDVSMLCALVRFSATVPDPDNNHFKRARTLFSERFPSPSSDASINFYAAIVNIGSLSARTRILIQAVEDQNHDSNLAIRHFKHILMELVEGSQRVIRSYRKIQEKLDANRSSLEDRWHFKISEHPSAESALIFGIKILKNTLVADEAKWRSSALSKFSQSHPHEILARLDEKYFKGNFSPIVRQLNRLNSILLENIDNKSPEHHGSLLELAIKNPPTFLRSLHDAIVTAWNQETAGPVIEVLQNARVSFKDLSNLEDDWNHFYAHLNPDQQREFLKTYYTALEKNGIRELLDAEQNSQKQLTEKSLKVLDAIENNLNNDDKNHLELVHRTRQWIEINLW